MDAPKKGARSEQATISPTGGSNSCGNRGFASNIRPDCFPSSSGVLPTVIISIFISASVMREFSGFSNSSECLPACSCSKYPLRNAQQVRAFASSRMVIGRSMMDRSIPRIEPGAIASREFGSASCKACFAEHDIQILMGTGKLEPLGEPAPNAPKWFCAIEIIRLATDRDWLHRATREISKHWRQKRPPKTRAMAQDQSAEPIATLRVSN